MLVKVCLFMRTCMLVKVCLFMRMYMFVKICLFMCDDDMSVLYAHVRNDTVVHEYLYVHVCMCAWVYALVSYILASVCIFVHARHACAVAENSDTYNFVL